MKTLLFLSLSLMPLWGQNIDYSRLRGGPGISVTAYGADPSGVRDSTSAINAAIIAMQAHRPPVFNSSASTVLLFPPGIYKHTGLTISGTMYISGSYGSGATATLLYTGTGTALTLTGGPSGSIANINIRSTTGSGSASVGIDMTDGTEISLNHVQIGGGDTSGFTTGLRIRSTGLAHLDYVTTSWCATGILFDKNTSSSSAITIDHGNFFLSTVAAINLRDVGALTIAHSWFEAIQAAILVDNTSFAVQATGIKLIDNSTNLAPSYAGTVFTNPQFIKVHGGNVLNSLVITGMQVEHNNVGGSPGSYCNTLTSSGTSVGGNVNGFLFKENHWSGCTSAVVNADDRMFIFAQDESPPAAVPQFSGAMYGNELTMDTGANLITTRYTGGYLTPVTLSTTRVNSFNTRTGAVTFTAGDLTSVNGIIRTPHTVTPTAVCNVGTPTIGTNSNDRAGEIIVGAGVGVTSCTVTFGTAFAAQVYGPMVAIYIPPGSTVTQFSQSPSGFVMSGTAMAGVQATWAFPEAN